MLKLKLAVFLSLVFGFMAFLAFTSVQASNASPPVTAKGDIGAGLDARTPITINQNPQGVYYTPTATPKTTTNSIESSVAALTPFIGNVNDRAVVPIPSGFNWMIKPTPGTDVAWERWRIALDIQVEAIMAKYPSNYNDINWPCGIFNVTPTVTPNGPITSAAELAELEAFGLAVAYKTGAYPYDVYSGYPIEKVKIVALKLLKSLANHHISNSDASGWGSGYDTDVCPAPYAGFIRGNWTIPLNASKAAFAAWLLWDEPDFTDSDRSKLRNMVEYEADRFIQSPFYHASQTGIDQNFPSVAYHRDRHGTPVYVPQGASPTPDYDNGDTHAEENAWMARMLYVATAMMPNHPHWDAWMNKSVELALSSTARPSDIGSSTLYHNKTINNWLNGTNIEGTHLPYWSDVGVVVNGGVVSPIYFPLIGNTMLSGLTSTLARRSTPKGTLNSNMAKIYEALTAQIQTRPPNTSVCPNGIPYETSGSYGSIYIWSATPRPENNYICFPEDLVHKTPRIDSLALLDTMVQAYGFAVSDNPNCNVPCFELLHTAGVLTPSSGGPLYPNHYPTPTPAPPSTPTATYIAAYPVDPPGIDKIGEAYLIEWLQKQHYFQTPLKDYAEDLPHLWRDQDLGASNLMGTASYSSSNNGTFTLQGGGSASSTPTTSEEFHLTYQLWEGDGEIVAHRQSWTLPSGSTAQAGIMIREELTTTARFAQVLFQENVRDSDGGFDPYFKWRTTPGATSSLGGMGSDHTTWNWIKLKRHGNVFTAYGGTNGSSWTQIGTSQTINMSNRVYVGLTAASLTDARMTATFDNVSLSRTNGTMGSVLPILTATASSNPNLAFQSYDGDPATNWQGDGALGNGQWIRYDLGALGQKKINAMSINWFGGWDSTTNTALQRIQAFDIQVSNGGPATGQDMYWTTVFTGTSAGANSDEVYNFPPVVARYIRVVGHGNSTGWWCTINEVKIYGSSLTSVSLTPTGITVSHPGVGAPASTLDDDLRDDATHAWGIPTPTPPVSEWIQYPIASPGAATVGSVAIAWAQGQVRSTRFDVQTSANGTSWKDVLTGALSSGRTNGLEYYTLTKPDTGVNYVRIVGHGNTDSPEFRITEVKVYSDN